MRRKVLVTREVFEDVLAFLGRHFEVSSNQEDTPLDGATLAHRAQDKDGLLTSLLDRVDEALLSACPGLRAVCNMAVGYNNLDLAACTRHGVLATNTPGVLDDTTADFTWALILAVARRLREADRWLRGGNWKGWRLKQFLGIDVHGKTLGILGMGGIGRKVARRAAGFAMTVLYHNRKRALPEIEAACGATYVSFEELLRRSDILTVHVPYSAETHHILGAAALAQMKEGALLVNVARGGVLDDRALLQALRSGRLAGAGLDVFEGEPDLDPGFLELQNVLLTPHVASSSEAARHAMAMAAAENLVAALTNGRPPGLLNPLPA